MKIIDLYKKIFTLIPETCKILGVHKVVDSLNETNSIVTKFICLIKVPIYFDDISPEKNICNIIRNSAIRALKINGPMVTKIVRSNLIIFRKYIYTIDLNPENILYFYVKNSILYIECFGYGLSY